MTDPPLLVGIGGFLGAGKTTLIVSAATRLRAAGTRVAVITNDQATGLVDTAQARDALDIANVAEIAGGCFCCRFDDLARTLHEVIDRAQPDIILAEAVGSCTDLAATVYQPIRQLRLAPVRLGPLTVIADALRLRSLARFGALPQLNEDVGYLYGQQLAEADVLLLNKIDLVPPEEAATLRARLARQHPGVPVLPVSALAGDGLDAWLEALVERTSSGNRTLDRDYDRYADAEACLGWLNLEGSVALAAGGDAATWAREALAQIGRQAASAGAAVAHVKLRLEGASGAVRANLTATGEQPYVTRSVTATPGGSAPERMALVLNARVATEPEALRGWVEAALHHADGAAGTRTQVASLLCFSPARPVPTHRLQPASQSPSPAALIGGERT